MMIKHAVTAIQRALRPVALMIIHFINKNSLIQKPTLLKADLQASFAS